MAETRKVFEQACSFFPSDVDKKIALATWVHLKDWVEQIIVAVNKATYDPTSGRGVLPQERIDMLVAKHVYETLAECLEEAKRRQGK